MAVSLPLPFGIAAVAFDDVPDRPSLSTPGLVVLAFGVVLAVQSVPPMAVGLADGSTSTLRLATGTGLVTVAGAAPFNLAVNVTVAFVCWLGLASVTHAGARLAGGTGTFRRTLATVAWCAAPLAVAYGAIVAVAAGIAATSDASLAAVIGGHALEFVPGRPPAYFDGDGLGDVRAWLLLAGVATAARIWVRAVPAAHGDGVSRGAAVVGVAVVALATLAAFR